MKEPKSSTPLQVAASRANGRNGGTKSPDISRWNAVVHALTAKDLTIHEGKHLPEYGQFAAMKRELLQDLARFGALSLEECVAVDKCIADAWRLARAYRFELSETEKADNGMLSPAMPTLLRYINLANRQVAESFARIQEIRKRKEEAAAKSAAAAAHELGGDGQTASEPAAGDTLSETPVSVEPLDTAPATSQPAAAVEGEMPAATEAPEPQGPDRPGS